MNLEEDLSPKLIELPKTNSKGGALSFIEEGEDLLFKVRRIYWIYEIEQDTERGNHSHEFSHRFIVCLNGKVTIELEDLYKEHYSFQLTQPNQALYIPPKHWINFKLSKGAIMISGASHLFEDDITMTSYEDFLSLGQI